MTRRRDPFAAALESLRGRAEQGVYPPGGPVVIMDEARRLNLSTTPVREALVWLSGYGLMERSPTGGFLAPRLERAIVRDRFAFRLQCVTGSLTAAGDVHGHDLGRGSGDLAGLDLAGHMLTAVRRAGNAALVDAYVRVCRQLIQLEPAERRLFPDHQEEERAVSGLFEAGGDALAEGLALYHRRRIEAAPLLILEAEAARRET
ncbi:hypothetical protein [Brevundimonas sp.]|uniref:hypothetical protein n=1 Tax=Brevundimonas sp. TaxID=1871086 RepID=UPI0028AD0D51|nr:hypothetical protein [Brevundimonas sp.]